eukprot:2944475-Amphidinium_carterae.1
MSKQLARQRRNGLGIIPNMLRPLWYPEGSEEHREGNALEGTAWRYLGALLGTATGDMPSAVEAA